jgi:tellurite resistance protein TerC
MQQPHTMLQHPGILIGFGILVIIMLLLDLGIFNKNSHVVSNKEAMGWSIVWISLSMIFSGIIYLTFKEDSTKLGFEKFSQFQSAYWIEKALSVDNLFVFILVFRFFKVSKELHHKVLFWGIIGALIFRAIFIFAGVGLINLTYLPYMEVLGQQVQINILLLIFGIFLIYAGIKSAITNEHGNEDKDYNSNPGAKLIHRFFKVSRSFDGDKFFTLENGIKKATPLLVVVAVIEFTDLLFAVDSIPAIFAIAPNDPFILYTSNIFAILGLRALYFLLANFIDKFYFLKYGLAAILTFIGIKMVIAPFFHISSPASLAVVGGVLILSLIISLTVPKK